MHAPSRPQPLLHRMRPRAHEQPRPHSFVPCWGVVQRQTRSRMKGESGRAPLDPSQEQKPAAVNQAVNLQLVGCSELKTSFCRSTWPWCHHEAGHQGAAPAGWNPSPAGLQVTPSSVSHGQPQRVRATVRNTLSDPDSSSPCRLASVGMGDPTSALHFISETPSPARHVGLV